MADTTNLTNFLQDVADAIKEKKEYESSQKILAADFDTEIASIETGVDTSDATATANDILAPKTAYVNEQKVIGNIIPTYKSASNTIHLTENNYNKAWLDYRPDLGYALTNENTLSVYDITGNTPVIVATYSTNISYNQDAKFAPTPCYVDEDNDIIIYNIFVGGMGEPATLTYYRGLTAVRFNTATGEIYSGELMSTSLKYYEKAAGYSIGRKP